MEQTGTNKNNPTKPAASLARIDPRKRKKDMEKTEAQGTTRARLDLGWRQTEEEVSINTKVEGEADKVEVSFTDRQMTILLPDGQQQSWHFHGAIDETQSKVSRSKRKFNMTVVKKERGIWPSLEVSEPVQESASEEKQQQQQQQEEQRETTPEVPSPNCDSPDGDSLQELRTKEEEPVLNLHYIKHDFFERDDTLTIHIYVKNVNKDMVKIHFDKQSFTVKFQTGDAKFLQLHEGTSEETVFCWTVNTKSIIIPSECKWKTTNACIELKLKKASTDRWSSLEASLKKETSSTSKSTSWMPAAKQQSTPAAGTSKGAGSSVVFDEMSQVDDNRRGFDFSEASSASQLSSASVKSQKPMAKVQPLNTQVVAQDIPPGYTGLDNLTNTCYVNTVVQVLANTPELRQYFMGGGYKEDINPKTDGEVARCFAGLLKTLWSGIHKHTTANRLKDLVSRRGNNSFQGFYQHDAQEFLSYLLDALHEDVNRAKKLDTAAIQDKAGGASVSREKKDEGPSAESSAQEAGGEQKEAAEDSAKKPVHVIAEEKWSAHKKKDDSFLVDLMYGQYKNKVTCPNCKEVSTTFEPFSILPLALPKNKKNLTVTFMWRDAQKKPIKYQIQLMKEPTVEHLTEQLSHKTGVSPKNMRVFDVKNSLFYRRFRVSSDLSRVDSKDIIVSEVLSADDAGEEVVEIEVIQRILHPPYPVSCSSCKTVCHSDKKLKRCTSCFKVGYCNQACQRNHWHMHKPHCTKSPDPVGCPFVLSLPRSHCTYGRIARLMESFARYSVDTFQPPVKADAANIPAATPPSASTTPATATTTTPTPLKTPAGGAGGSMLPPSGELHLPSHPSGSNLSSSSGSQSSGSLSSLDSISSCSSTATLTADTSHATFDVGHSGGEEDGEDEEGKEACRDERGGGDVDSGLGSVSSCQAGGTSQASTNSSAQGDLKQDGGQEKDGGGSYSTDRSTAGGSSSNVQSVAASMSSDRSVPLFFIKPVDAEGRGRRVDRLEDRGDTVLDMSSNRHLSMDWRNNENQPSYVLVQSKELEAEEDDSMKTPRFMSETLTLQQCLDLYHAPEILSERNAWTCDKCKRKQEALKQCFLWKIPHICIIQLKRFTSFDVFNRKIDTKVDFPIRGLDLTPYKYHHDPNDPPALYDLYGVINHIGSTLGGHYTCRARCADLNSPFQNEVEWRLFDDWQVYPVNNEKSVVDQNAYVLFYRRRQPFVPPPVVQRIAAPDVEQQAKTEKDVTIKEKSEEESSKEKERKDGQAFVNLKGDGVERDGDEVEEEEKQDPEKGEEEDGDRHSGGEDEGEGGGLVIDMEASHHQEHQPLGYTDMDAVD
ncbi:ubiquitin carboxyl-terminal hydrolase 19-like [Babylonia areolata]|uniref:ubiquitin carboxyl-terminal hydrolase 19-like n=1 Tax=Babylonia areolata TaxID=304850 RepID=UPI003FD00DCE